MEERRQSDLAKSFAKANRRGSTDASRAFRNSIGSAGSGSDLYKSIAWNNVSDDDDSSRETETSRRTVAEKKAEEDTKFVQQETRYVLLLKIATAVILVCAAIAISAVVYLITTRAEQESFEQQYYAVANKISDTFLDILRSKMGAAASLTVSQVAHGQDQSKTWPFITLSFFQQRAFPIKSLSGALSVEMNPAVQLILRQKWQYYSTTDYDNKWYREGLQYQRELGLDHLDQRPPVETPRDPNLNVESGIGSQIFTYGNETDNAPVPARWKIGQVYLPVWQMSPVTRRTVVNQDRAQDKGAQEAFRRGMLVLERMKYSHAGFSNDTTSRQTSEFAYLLSMANEIETMYQGDIFSSVFFPLYNNFEQDREVVGVMRTVIQWGRYFANVLPPDDKVGVTLVLENGGCDPPYTYKIQGDSVFPMGQGDLHDATYDPYQRNADLSEITQLNDGTEYGMDIYHGPCAYSIRVYPSKEFYNSVITSTPATITISIAAVFLFCIFMFFVYDRLVEWRQSLIMDRATQTHNIVAGLFPKNVRERLFEQEQDKTKDASKNRRVATGLLGPSSQVKSYLDDSVEQDNGLMGEAPPIADLFPHSTIFFADIAGFTAWSSSREPVQVFILLQKLYKAFDDCAKVRKVFKVETIGDSYVAVTGLPEPQSRHASIMARFAADCLRKTAEVTRNLERTLGPDTGDLSIRIGINSGPVTAGVLRGERSRFQLFGDTVNTAARMESTGVSGKIQASQSTVDALIAEGKGHWAQKRADDVLAKGKGVLSTFFITPHSKTGSTVSGSSDPQSSIGVSPKLGAADAKKARLVDWMTKLLWDQLQKIAIHHKGQGITRVGHLVVPKREKGKTNLDEVVEAIELPEFDPKAVFSRSQSKEARASDDLLDPSLVKDLRKLVKIIASTYNDNPFHNFEHACHVTMNVSKFLNRIVNPEIDEDKVNMNNLTDGKTAAAEIASHLHDYTHGINSDPVTIFAIIFAALIHDAGHKGISNEQLMKEEPALAEAYRGKSVAEQYSLDTAYDLLASDQFRALREGIFATQEEFLRFRQVVVNVVLATDIFDKELSGLRKARWEKAFAQDSSSDAVVNNKLRATIVMEHIIQASDVCHTMQHWHVYRKWNKRLFHELLLAHRTGRMKPNPEDFWYKGELGFFDNYIIPLAKKLATCKVFGVSSDEVLNYALKNRAEWESCGQQVVEEMKQEFAEVGGGSTTGALLDEEIVVAPEPAPEAARPSTKLIDSSDKWPADEIQDLEVFENEISDNEQPTTTCTIQPANRWWEPRDRNAAPRWWEKFSDEVSV